MIKEKFQDIIIPGFPQDDQNKNLLTSIIAGTFAGVFVDFTLFPLDTLKTRLQSERGLWRSGGLSGVYKGLLPVMLASAPTSAIFFLTYNGLTNKGKEHFEGISEPFVHIGAASFGEIAVATLRVPIEIIKQRKQVSSKFTSNLDIISWILKREGFKGLYRGWSSTLLRDIPFAATQFPLWEYFKKSYQTECLRGEVCSPIEGATCGAIAGAIAGAITTPMDVVKTRVMLLTNDVLHKVMNERQENVTMFVVRQIYEEGGAISFFKGIVPRVLWITVGGFVFFGVYDKIISLCTYKD